MKDFEFMSENEKIFNAYSEQFACKLLSAQEEINLATLIRDYGDYEAKELLFNSNFRLVYKIAEDYKNSGVDFEDLFQEGLAALWKIIDKYNPDMGYRFSTFAQARLAGCMIDHISYMSHSNKISKDDYENHKIIVAAINAFENKNDRKPTLDELDRLIPGLSKKVIANNMRVFEAANSVHIDAKISEDDEDSFESILPSNTPVPYEIAEKGSDMEAYEKAVNKLSGREREFFAKKYGMFNYKKMSNKEIANESNLSEERVRQIVNGAAKKLSKDKDLRAAVKGGD